MIEVNRGAAEISQEEVQQIAEKIRYEPYRLLTNNCYHKSWKFLKEASIRGITAKMCPVIGLGRARLPFLGWRVKIPVLHSWVEVEGKRIEVSHPLGEKSIWEIAPVDVKPILTIRFNPLKCPLFHQ